MLSGRVHPTVTLSILSAQILAGAWPAPALADGFFAGRDLDYWNEGKRVRPAVSSTRLPSPSPAQAAENSLPPPSGSIIRQRDALPFDWVRYSDPKFPEFWDDGGDYVAPRPMREAVTHPTKENLDRYVTWQAKRLEVIAEFSEKLALHVLASETSGAPKASTSPAPPPSITAFPQITQVTQAKRETLATSKASPRKDTAVRWAEVEILYFYQSSCTHCQAEKDHVEDLTRRGARVSFIQLDADERPPLHARSIPYTRAHSDQFAIRATPTWILRRHEKIVRLEGEQDDATLVSRASELFGTQDPS